MRLGIALIASLFVLAPALLAQKPRTPLGIYAVVKVEDDVTQQQTANPSVTTAQLDAFFNSLYQGLLQDPAISGLALQVHWDTLNPNPPGAANTYLWNYVDDAFAQVAAWDAQNTAQAPKTIQLIVTPGFQSPQWLLTEIPSCDGLFETPSVATSSTCGKATFTGYLEAADGNVLPLPWNPIYKSAWQTFLTALAARYGSNPAFISIAVDGPTAASAEMIMPSNGNSSVQTQFGGIMPNDMWRALFALQYPGMAAYQSTDQAFIDEWENAIDMFGQVFSGVTLVATTGDGLPNFNSNYTIPPALSGDCPSPDQDCGAETTILAYFMEPAAGGANAKATQTSGLEAARGDVVHNMGVAGVKLQSQATEQLTTPSTQILGGAQFNTSFSNDPVGEGCTSAFPPDSSDTPAACTDPSAPTQMLAVACIPQACLAPGVTQATLAGYADYNAVPNKDLISPEQAEYNVLNVYFGGTAAAPYFGATAGPTPAPMNYMQIYAPDIQYAQMNVNAPAQVVETNGTVSTTAQALLNLASQELMQIAEPPTFFAGGVWLGSGVYYLQFLDSNLFGYFTYLTNGFIYHFDMGYEYVDAVPSSSTAYLWDLSSGHWWYASSSLFPYLYDFTLKAWLYYFPSTTNAGHYTTNPRYFSNLTTGKVFTM